MLKINRDTYLQKLIDSIGNGMVKVITGIRRCGKSYLLRTIFKDWLLSNGTSEDQILEIPLDNNKYYDLWNPNALASYLRQHLSKDRRTFLFIDEIQLCQSIVNPAFKSYVIPNNQEIPQITFHSVLNELLSDYPNVETYVTGSNSKMLSKDIITEFRGRGWEIKLFPLSFKEYYSATEGHDRRIKFHEFLNYGGMPMSLNFPKDDDKANYLHSLFEETYFKDVIERNHLRANNHLRELTQIMASSLGSLTNVSHLQRIFSNREDKSISRATIDSYIQCLEDSFLIYKANRFDIRGNKLIDSTNKFYFVDTGLRNACLNFSTVDFGHLMESIIYLELLRRGFSVNVGVVNYWKDSVKREQYEIDFIACQGKKKYYIQSLYQIHDDEQLRKESRSFLKVNDNFKKIMIHYDSFKQSFDDNGIAHIGITDFLLDDHYLD